MATMIDPQTTTPAPVALRTRRDHLLTVQALEHRAEGLEKLAKKNEDEGYTREAKTQLADVAAIRSFILPQFRAQQEMALVSTEQLRGGIIEALRYAVRGHLVVRAPEERQEDALRDREERLLESLAVHIEAYATAVAEDAYAAGYAARENDPEVIAHRQLGALTVA